MDSSTPDTHTFSGFAYAVAMSVAGAVGVALSTIARYLWNKRGNQPLTKALGGKAEAESRHLDGETLARAYDRIDELMELNGELLMEKAEWRVIRADMQRSIDLAGLDMEWRDKEVQKLHAILKLHNLRYSDYDHIKGEID